MGESTREGLQHVETRPGRSIHVGFFDRGARTQVIADAIPVGLGAVLVQEVDGQSRAVCYVSRRLSDTEHRYSQTAKVALEPV